jgi:hypothetical protein
MTRPVIYDAGMLIGLANRTARVQAQHELSIRRARPIVPGPVLAQVWRGGGSAQAILSRYLRDCQTFTVYSEHDYKRVGLILGHVSLPARKRPDVIDALVALTAANHDAIAVLTSDPLDISAYLDTMPKARTVVIPV